MPEIANITELVRQNRIEADTSVLSEKINFKLASLEALNVSEEKHFWARVRQSLVTSLISRFGKSACHFLDIGCGNGSLL